MSTNLQKWSPWNWFRKEDEEPHLPAWHGDDLFRDFHRDIDRMFDRFMRGLSFPAVEAPALPALLRPNVDIAETGKDYTISMEVPGVDEKDVRLELSGNTLTISGEKRQEKESKDRNWHRVERSYGSFRRVLSLPEDANTDKTEATFRNGVLTITLPRTTIAKPESVRRIEISKAA